MANTLLNHWLALALLTATYVFAYADRYLLAMLVQPIKQEFGLSDAQIGLLTGLAFSAFYAIAGLPLGRLADRVSRRKLMAYSIAAWSVMTSLSGAARSFGYALVVIAIGAGALAIACYVLGGLRVARTPQTS